MNHRSLLTLLLSASIGLCAADHAASPAALSPDQALKELLAGNERYCAKGMTHPHQSATRRTELAKTQHPFAIVLSCSDSRVPPEVVFDQGLGDLFVIRVAGNVPSDEVIASIEYAVAHLGSKLIVVLGHERCGAVAATLEGGAPEGHLASLIDRIQPAVQKAKKQGGDVLDSAVRINVEESVSLLKSAKPLLSKAAAEGHVKILGARYDLDSGKIEVLP
jgi:carbonic anhydrase